MGHLVANGPHLEAIAQHAKRRGVPLVPEIAQTDQSHAKFHDKIFLF
jgi:hypothetical protein